MTANKTMPTGAPIEAHLDSIAHKGRREDAWLLFERMNALLDLQPRMWGDSIIGYGIYHYKYESGREGEFLMTGFAARKANMVVYVMPGFNQYAQQLKRLGNPKHSVSCLYLPRLNKLDLEALDEIILDAVRRMKEMYEWRA